MLGNLFQFFALEEESKTVKSKPPVKIFEGEKELKQECTDENVCRCGDRIKTGDGITLADSIEQHARFCPRLMMKCSGCGISVPCWSHQLHIFQCSKVPNPTFVVTTNTTVDVYPPVDFSVDQNDDDVLF
jgi:hypothetical protein